MNRLSLFIWVTIAMVYHAHNDLRLNDLEHFERQSVKVLVGSGKMDGKS